MVFAEFTQNLTLVTTLVYMNDVTGGVSSAMIIFAWFIIVFATLRAFGVESALAVAGWVSMITNTMLWGVGIINEQLFWITVGIFIVSFLILYLAKN